MKLNNKGFAVSIILYSMIAVITIIMLLILSIYSTNIHNKLTQAERIKERISNLNTLNNKILRDNIVIETSPELNKTNKNVENGLYKSIVTNSGQPTYYFRGNANNYVKLVENDNLKWRIVRINEDNTIKLVLDDPIEMKSIFYDVTKPHQFPNIFPNIEEGLDEEEQKIINKIDHTIYYSNMNNSNEIRKNLENWYNTNIKSKYSSKVTSGEYFCEQNKAIKIENNDVMTMANPFVYSKYTANFKCGTDGNGYGLVNTEVGLLSYDEVVLAGGYPTKENSNYYLYKNNYPSWTMSPSNANHLWIINSDGSLDISPNNNTNNYIRPVIILISDLAVVKGNGTKDSPYILK